MIPSLEFFALCAIRPANVPPSEWPFLLVVANCTSIHPSSSPSLPFSFFFVFLRALGGSLWRHDDVTMAMMDQQPNRTEPHPKSLESELNGLLGKLRETAGTGAMKALPWVNRCMPCLGGEHRIVFSRMSYPPCFLLLCCAIRCPWLVARVVFWEVPGLVPRVFFGLCFACRRCFDGLLRAAPVSIDLHTFKILVRWRSPRRRNKQQAVPLCAVHQLEFDVCT